MTFYIHGSVHRESNLIIVQQDATIFSLLHFCRQLYMFRVLTPIIRSWYSCNYSFWHRSAGTTVIRSRCWVGTDSPEACRAAYRNIIIWIQSHLVGQLLNLHSMTFTQRRNRLLTHFSESIHVVKRCICVLFLLSPQPGCQPVQSVCR